MSSAVLTTIFHFVVFTYYCYIYVYYKTEVDPKLPHHTTYGKDLKFLTIWSLLFQILYFFCCCVTDLIQTSGSRSPAGRSMASFRDWFLCSVAFPIGSLVVLMFWGIYMVDRELIFPKRLEGVYPMWLNHCMHTYLLVLMLVDMYLVKHQQPPRKVGISSLLVVSAGYLIWILWLGFAVDIWVYPILQVLEGYQFLLFVVFTALILAVMYFAGEKCNQFLGRNRPDPELMYAKID